MPTKTNNYYLKQEQLTSYVKAYSVAHQHQQLYFISIQPQREIFTEQQAKEYVKQYLPQISSCIIQLEQNDRTSLYLSKKLYSLLPTLHLHLILGEQYLELLPECITYTNTNDLKQQQRQAGVKSFTITATPVYNLSSLIAYLSKQTENSLFPIYYKPVNMTEQKKREEIIGIIELAQRLMFGITGYQLEHAHQLHLTQQTTAKDKFCTWQKIICKHLMKVERQILDFTKRVYMPYLPNAPNISLPFQLRYVNSF